MLKKGNLCLLFLLLIMMLLTGCSKNKDNDVSDDDKGTSDVTTLPGGSDSSTLKTTKEGPEQTMEYVDLFGTYRPKEVNPSLDEPHISIEKETFSTSESISVTCCNCGEKDWVGLYPYGGYPQDMDSLAWSYINNDSPVSIAAKQFKDAKTYVLYLCENDGYTVLDYKIITISDDNIKNYKIKAVSYELVDNEMLLTITPPTSRLLSYQVYWAKDGKRIEGYSYLKYFKKASSGAFTYSLGSYMLMPDDANQIEVKVIDGVSDSVFIDMDDSLKLYSKYLYSFNVYTDLHIRNLEDKPNHVTHLETALNDAYNYNRNSKALFTVGDHTDTGSLSDYACLTKLLNTYSKAAGCPVYYTLGNHDYMYANTYDEQVELFKKYAGTDDIFYTVEMEGSTCIFLGSDVRSTGGGITDEHVEWLKVQLEKADKTKPIFIFLHQPLIDTVAGSSETQQWYGIINNGKKIEAILANYKNAFLFTGHTHWEMESNNNIDVSLTGTTYINCAAVGYLWNDDNSGEPGSEGYFVDVYDDCLVVRGRDFIKGEWLAYATYKIPMNFES